MWRLLAKTYLFQSITSSDPLYMAAASGRRDVGLWLFNEVMLHAPDKFVIMQQEADGRERTDPGYELTY